MKKYKKIILLTCTLACTFFACEQDEIDTFSGENLIYFSWALDGVDGDIEARIDSTSFSFAYELPSYTDSIFRIPVKTQGFISDQDRAFGVKIGNDSEANEGIHFDLPDNFLIPANQVTGYIPITIHRTPEMKTKEISLKFELVSNENFSANLIGDTKSSNANKVLSYNKIEVTVSDILVEPSLWSRFMIYYLGTFSVKKFYLYAEVNNIPVPNWETAFPDIDEFFTHKNVLKAYLAAQKAAGTPVLEDDGTEMELGPYAKNSKTIKR